MLWRLRACSLNLQGKWSDVVAFSMSGIPAISTHIPDLEDEIISLGLESEVKCRSTFLISILISPEWTFSTSLFLYVWSLTLKLIGCQEKAIQSFSRVTLAGRCNPDFLQCSLANFFFSFFLFFLKKSFYRQLQKQTQITWPILKSEDLIGLKNCAGGRVHSSLSIRCPASKFT